MVASPGSVVKGGAQAYVLYFITWVSSELLGTAVITSSSMVLTYTRFKCKRGKGRLALETTQKANSLNPHYTHTTPYGYADRCGCG